MADLKIAKTAVKTGIDGVSAGQTAKAGPSQFDSIRSKIAEKVAADLKLPPVTKPDPQRIASIENGLKNKLERTDARSASTFFQVEMKNTRSGLDKLTQTVDKLPPQSAFGPIRQRLTDMEQQFQKSGDLIKGMKDMDPKSLLKVQVQLYQLSENMELMSRVVEQVSSGVKTVMQTQV